jgi:hypothetical protein
MGQSEAARELGVTVGNIGAMPWARAQVDAGIYSEQPATAASVKKLRNVDGNRWELIAARVGESVATVKDLFGGEEAAANSVISGVRSKKDNGDEEETPRRGRGRPAGSKTTTGKRATAAATPRRSRTRAQRQAGRGNNPS